MPTSEPFTIVTDTENDAFYILAPDGETAGESASPGEIATLEWEGVMYFATDDDDQFPGMEGGTVYALGRAQPTEEEDEDDEGDEDDAEAATGAGKGEAD